MKKTINFSNKVDSLKMKDKIETVQNIEEKLGLIYTKYSQYFALSEKTAKTNYLLQREIIVKLFFTLK